MRKATKLALIAGFGLGVLTNSFHKDVSEKFKFENPVPINATLREVQEIVANRPEMVDTTFSLDLFGAQIELRKTRSVTDPVTGKSYEGTLDSNGSIYTDNATYALRSAHDSSFYVPLK